VPCKQRKMPLHTVPTTFEHYKFIGNGIIEILHKAKFISYNLWCFVFNIFTDMFHKRSDLLEIEINVTYNKCHMIGYIMFKPGSKAK